MKESEKELLLAYFVNEDARLEAEFIELRNRVRFRKIDISDNVELMLLQQRIADFQEFALVVMRLLKL